MTFDARILENVAPRNAGIASGTMSRGENSPGAFRKGVRPSLGCDRHQHSERTVSELNLRFAGRKAHRVERVHEGQVARDSVEVDVGHDVRLRTDQRTIRSVRRSR